MTEKTTDDVLKAGNEIKLVLREIRNDAKAAGLEVGRIVNYLPRGFNFRAVQKELENLKEGIEGTQIKAGVIGECACSEVPYHPEDL